MARYEVLKHIPVGEDHFAPGDTIDSADHEDRDWPLMVRAGDVRPIAEVVGDGPRDENGDTAEMAEMRRSFDTSWQEAVGEMDKLNQQVRERGEANATLRNQLAERDATISDLRRELAELPTIGGASLENDGGGQRASESSGEAQTSEGTGETMTAIPAFSVKDKGRGWFAIVIDGQEVTKSLRADDVELFPAMTPAEQEAFVEANKPSD